MADLNEMLSGFTRVKGVAAASLVGGDGLPLQSVTAPGVDESEVDVLGAIAASGLVAAQDIGQQTSRGALRQAIYEYEKGVVVIEPLGNSILVVVTDAASNLGLLRLQARKANPALQAAVADL
jgi:predicted regulator of Ras-like GTPase activity (Roadblock/LC7/MglB family)